MLPTIKKETVMPYKIDELDIKNNSEEEQIRTRAIFEDLKSKAEDSGELTEHEKDFFCRCVKLSQLGDGKIEDYDCCSNFKFKLTYLSYFQNLTGFGVYEKVRGTEIYNPDRKEIDNDVNYLKNVAINWNSVISKTNHSEELLQQISKKTRDDLNKIEKSKGRLLFRRDKEKYLLDKRKTLLQSRYIYCMALQIFEMFDKTEFVLRLNGHDIELNEYSIIHILSNHFSEITKVATDKSFHIEDFEAQYLNKQIGEIFKDIDNSGLLDGKPIDKIAFKYKGIDYLIWTKEKLKYVKGTGEVRYKRLETFYPVERQSDLQELNDNYRLQEVNTELSVYVKND